MTQLRSVRFCKKPAKMRCVWGKQLWESVEEVLQEARNAVKPPSRLNSCKKKREREERKKRPQIAGPFSESFEEFLSPHQLWGIMHHPGKRPVSIPLMRWVTGGNSSYKVRSLPNTEMDSESRRGPQPIPPPSSKSSTSPSLSEPYTNLEGRINHIKPLKVVPGTVRTYMLPSNK